MSSNKLSLISLERSGVLNDTTLSTMNKPKKEVSIKATNRVSHSF